MSIVESASHLEESIVAMSRLAATDASALSELVEQVDTNAAVLGYLMRRCGQDAESTAITRAQAALEHYEVERERINSRVDDEAADNDAPVDGRGSTVPVQLIGSVLSTVDSSAGSAVLIAVPGQCDAVEFPQEEQDVEEDSTLVAAEAVSDNTAAKTPSNKKAAKTVTPETFTMRSQEVDADAEERQKAVVAELEQLITSLKSSAEGARDKLHEEDSALDAANEGMRRSAAEAQKQSKKLDKHAGVPRGRENAGLVARLVPGPIRAVLGPIWAAIQQLIMMLLVLAVTGATFVIIFMVPKRIV